MKFSSKGSYVVIRPWETDNEDEESCIGQVEFPTAKGYDVGDIVVYHANDRKFIRVNGKRYAAVLHYNIILKEEKEEKMEGKLKFEGMSADF